MQEEHELRTPARYEDANSRYRAELFYLRPLDLSSASLKPILWDGGREAERRGVASQLTKVSFRANKNRRIAETVDGASYRTSLAEKSYVWKYQCRVWLLGIRQQPSGQFDTSSLPLYTSSPVDPAPIRLEDTSLTLQVNVKEACHDGLRYVERTGVGRVTKQIYEGRVCASKGRVNINRVAQNSGRGCQIASTLLSSL
uniref:Uncharacterized protein n=1 Tax=Timema bartmani TaxID=61472 RepID=A0A7R9I225_9NEOP|nr:unnamed protein product [Timema bartmani]